MALFVPNQSQYNKLGSSASAPAEPEKIDLSWQLSLQEVWEKLLHGNRCYLNLTPFRHCDFLLKEILFQEVCIEWS